MDPFSSVGQRQRRVTWIVVLGLGVLLLTALGVWFLAPRTGGRYKPGQVYETVLGNGLTLLTQEVHEAPAVALVLGYRVGSRHDPPGLAGLSHVLARATYGQTAHWRQGDMVSLLTLVGGSSRSVAYRDWTGYYLLVPSHQVETALQVERERMFNCSLPEGEWPQHRGSAQAAWWEQYGSPEAIVTLSLYATAFPHHPYRFPVGGLGTTLPRSTPSAAFNFYTTYYVPRNAVLVAVGDFRTAELKRWVKRYLGRLPDCPTPPEPPAITAPEPTARQRVTVAGPGTEAWVALGFRGPGLDHADTPGLYVLSYLLSSETSTPLYEALVRSGLARYVQSAHEPAREASLFRIVAPVPPKQDVPAVEAALFDYLRRLREQPITPQERAAAVGWMAGAFVRTRNGLAGQAGMLAHFALVDEWPAVEREVARLQAVTADDVQRVARTYLTPERSVVLHYRPGAPFREETLFPDLSPPAVVAAPALRPRVETTLSLRFWQQAQPVPEPVQPAPVQRGTLPNGLTWIVCPSQISEQVVLAAQVRAGTAYEPAGSKGVTYVLERLMPCGTARRSLQEVRQTLGRWGGSWQTQRQSETAVHRLEVPQAHWTEGLTLLAEVLRQPALPPDEFDAQRRACLAEGFHLANTDLRGFSRFAFQEAFWPPDHPYRWSWTAERDGLERVTREQVLRFHRRHYRPDTTTLVIVGPVEPTQVKAEVARTFGDWTATGKPPTLHFPPLPGPEAEKQRLPRVRSPRHSQACVVLGGSSPARNDPDYEAFTLCLRILENSLEWTLSTQHALPCTVRSEVEPHTRPGMWALHLLTAPDQAATVARLGQEYLRRFPAETHWEWNLKAVGGERAAGWLWLLQQPTNLADALAEAEQFNLGLDYPWQAWIQCAHFTSEQLQRVATQWMSADDCRTLIVGP